MKRTMRQIKLIAAAVLATSALGFGNMAHAALTNCPSSFVNEPGAKVEDVTGSQTAASDCQYVTPPDNNNVANLANINTAGFFGHSDWVLNGTNLQVGPGGATGTWAISNANFATFDYIIVFKDGNNTNLTAFLFNEVYTSGVWSTPFTDPPFDLNGNSTSHDVSHYTIAQRTSGGGGGGGGNVPEPASLSLLGLGLIGIAAARRRKVT